MGRAALASAFGIGRGVAATGVGAFCQARTRWRWCACRRRLQYQRGAGRYRRPQTWSGHYRLDPDRVRPRPVIGARFGGPGAPMCTSAGDRGPREQLRGCTRGPRHQGWFVGWSSCPGTFGGLGVVLRRRARSRSTSPASAQAPFWCNRRAWCVRNDRNRSGHRRRPLRAHARRPADRRCRVGGGRNYRRTPSCGPRGPGPSDRIRDSKPPPLSYRIRSETYGHVDCRYAETTGPEFRQTRCVSVGCWWPQDHRTWVRCCGMCSAHVVATRHRHPRRHYCHRRSWLGG